MFRTIWTHDTINSNEPLQYFVNAAGCKIKVQNSSKYAIDVYVESEHTDRIEPYSYSVLPNENYTLKVNRDVVSQNIQENELITFKTVSNETTIGSTTFTGVQHIEGDVNVEGTVNVDGTVNVAGNVGIDGEVNVNGTVAIDGDVNVNGNVEVNNIVQTETIITNATIPITAPNGLDVNIQNGVLQVEGAVDIKSGVIQAEIKNASISTELVNAAIGVNSVVVMYEESYDIYPYNESVKQIYARGLSTSKSIYDKFQIEVSMQGHHEEFELGDGQVIPETFYAEKINYIEPNASGILCSGIYTDQHIYQSNFKQVATTDEKGRPVQKGILYCYIDEPELLDEIQFEVASRVFTGYGGGRALGRIKVDVKVYAYNSKSFKNIKEGSEAFLKGIELGTDKKKTDSLISQDGTLKLNGNTVYEPLVTVHAGLNLNDLNVTGTYYSHGLTNTIGKPPAMNSTTGFITHNERSAGYATQLLEQATGDHKIFHRKKLAGVWTDWIELKTSLTPDPVIPPIPIVKAGGFAIKPTAANTVTSVRVNFTEPFPVIPSVSITPLTSVPNIVTCGIAGVDVNGFTAYMTRTNTTSTSFHYIAVNPNVNTLDNIEEIKTLEEE